MNNLVSSDVLPTCFIVTVGLEDTEHASFVTRFTEIEKKNFVRERMPAKHCQDNWWLVKPANMNQGKGIKIYNNMKEIMSHLAQQQPNSLWVVQKYIERPLLYNTRKFDIRMWVLVTHNYDIHYYKKSYVRTSSSAYDLKETQDYLTHLTNNCFQVLSDTYGQFEEGNIITLKQLESYIRDTKEPNYTLEECFFPWAVSHCVDVILAGSKKMRRVPGSFELFGFDLMIDEDLRVWLIECNVNPHLGTPNEMMKKNVPEMLNEMMTIVLDPVFPPKNPQALDKYPKGNWALAHSSTHKGRDHQHTKQLYPVKTFAQETKSTNRRNRSPQPILHFEDDDRINSRQVMKLGKLDSVREEKKVKTYAIDSMNGLLRRQMSNATVDEFQLVKCIDRLFSCFNNWELYSDEQVSQAMKSVSQMLDTQFDYLVVSEKNINILVSMLKVEEIRLDLMIQVLNMINKIASRRKMRVSLSNNIIDIIDMLSKVLYCCLHGEDRQSYPMSCRTLCCQAMINLAEQADRHVYVPGETNEREQIMAQVMLSGGYAVLMGVRKSTFNPDDDLNSMIDRFFDQLELEDWLVQQALLKFMTEIYTGNTINLEKLTSVGDLSKQLTARQLKTLERAVLAHNRQQNSTPIDERLALWLKHLSMETILLEFDNYLERRHEEKSKIKQKKLETEQRKENEKKDKEELDKKSKRERLERVVLAPKKKKVEKKSDGLGWVISCLTKGTTEDIPGHQVCYTANNVYWQSDRSI